MEKHKCKYVGWILEDLIEQEGEAYPDEDAMDPESPFKDQWYFIPDDKGLWPAQGTGFKGYLVHKKELGFDDDLESGNL